MTDPCPHGQPPPRGRADVAKALARAEAVCTQAGENWTAQRRRVYELLLGSVEPVKAYELLTKLRLGAVAKPPTVYRALDFLIAHGLAHRLETQAAFVPCGLEHPHTRSVAFLICDCCGQVAEFDPDPAAVAASARAVGFALSRTVMEAQGTCSTCQGPATPAMVT